MKGSRKSIDRLYIKGDWSYLAKKLESDYPYKADIDKQAEKETKGV